MELFQRRMPEWTGDEMEDMELQIEEGERKLIFIVQDESIIYSNDAKKVVWEEDGKSTIRPKGNGQSLHISGFCCACHGFQAEAFKIITPGKAHDGYWTNADLVDQFEHVVPFFKHLHPGDDLMFAFDNSSNHHAKAPGALCVQALNLSDGGSKFIVDPATRTAPKVTLRDTVWNGQIQSLTRADGVQKGIRTILQERNAWVPGLKLQCTLECNPPDCCARTKLGSHPDFASERSWIQTSADKLGVQLIFFPKFHCELNFIEMVWGYLKRYLRKVCSFSFKDLRERLPQALLGIPIKFFKKVSRHCFRYMSGYRMGLQGPALDYAIKKYTSHRCIPPTSLQLIQDEFRALKKCKPAQLFAHFKRPLVHCTI